MSALYELPEEPDRGIHDAAFSEQSEDAAQSVFDGLTDDGGETALAIEEDLPAAASRDLLVRGAELFSRVPGAIGRTALNFAEGRWSRLNDPNQQIRPVEIHDVDRQSRIAQTRQKLIYWQDRRAMSRHIAKEGKRLRRVEDFTSWFLGTIEDYTGLEVHEDIDAMTENARGVVEAAYDDTGEETVFSEALAVVTSTQEEVGKFYIGGIRPWRLTIANIGRSTRKVVGDTLSIFGKTGLRLI